MKKYFAVGALGIVVLLSGCGSEPPAQAEDQVQATQPSAEPSPAPSPSATEVILDQPVETAGETDTSIFSPESLKNMSHAELVELATITTEDATTPEEYAQAYMLRLDAWLNSGGTASLYDDSHALNVVPDDFQQATLEQYNPAFVEGLYAPTAPMPTSFIESHSTIVHYGMLAQSGIPYHYDIDYASSEVRDYDGPEDEVFSVTIKYAFDDNLVDSGVEAVLYSQNNLPYEPDATPRDISGEGSFTLKVKQDNGVYKVHGYESD